MRFCAFHDAGWASRLDGSSQGGYMSFACHAQLLDGHEATVNLIDWKSWKLKRVCRSSLAAECQSMAEALDNLIFGCSGSCLLATANVAQRLIKIKSL